MSTAPRSVAIAIPTFQRPDMLAALLRQLPDRIAEVNPELAHVVAVIVVDNDPAESARTTTETFAAVLPVRYAPESRPGIASARNRALDAAADAQLLAFIDDDEVPDPEWLSALVSCRDTYDATAVMGHVVSVLPEGTDPWLIATGTFTRKLRTTGDVMPVAAAGNLLLDLEFVRRFGIRFDDSLGLAGGEDTLFTSQLTQAGGRIVWCGESVATDTVIASRVTKAWARTRAFHNGNAAVQAELRSATSRLTRARVRCTRLPGGVLRVAAGFTRHLAGKLRRNLTADARGWRLLHRGRGMVAGSIGHVHQEYSRDDNAPR